MKRKKKFIVRIAFVMTMIGVVGLYMGGQSLKTLNDKVDGQLELERKKLTEQQEKLANLEAEIEQSDSVEYIEKVATEQLGLIKEDTIVFKQKQ